MGFEEARSRLMLRARGRSRHMGVRVKAQNAVTEPRGVSRADRKIGVVRHVAPHKWLVSNFLLRPASS